MPSVRQTQMYEQLMGEMGEKSLCLPSELGHKGSFRQHRDQSFDSNQIKCNGKKVSNSFPENSFPRSIHLPWGYFVASVTFQEIRGKGKKKAGNENGKFGPKTIFASFGFL